MCTYNIHIDDRKASVLQTRFKDNHSVELWMQQQVEILIADITRNANTPCRHAMTMPEAMDFMQSLAIPGAERIPADVKPIDCLASEKYA